MLKKHINYKEFSDCLFKEIISQLHEIKSIDLVQEEWTQELVIRLFNKQGDLYEEDFTEDCFMRRLMSLISSFYFEKEEKFEEREKAKGKIGR